MYIFYCIISSTQSLYALTLVNTSGAPLAHGRPHDTIPTKPPSL